MWTQSKDLYSLVENTLNNQNEPAVAKLERALKHHRSDFAALLKHPVRVKTKVKKFRVLIFMVYFFL